MNKNNQTTLKEIRERINNIDEQLLNLLVERVQIISEIANYKKQNKLKIRDIKREEEMILNRKEKAKKLNLDEKFVEKITRLIIKNSIEIQKKIIG